MCGICGFVGEVADRSKVIELMTDLITHRGPDSAGFFADNNVSMGFRRLSIIDVDSGAQPIYNEDNTLVLTFNGEIYNYQSLKDELVSCGHKFYTNTDSEVLLHGFEQWGEDLLNRLRGMFSFAIWNRKDNSLFLARDPFGIKPLHYCKIGESFVYASEIKSILVFPYYEKKLNMRALDNYLSFQYVPPPDTIFNGIFCLMPGSYLHFKDGQVSIKKYFTPRFNPKNDMDQEKAVEGIEKVVENSVHAHRISDVPVGCFLSSGVDSSFVASYFTGEQTFTVGFDLGEKYNEISWAKNVAKMIGSEHSCKIITADEFWKSVSKVCYYMDQPLGDPSCIALYFVSKLASKYVKVVLSGEGADEIFGGYNIYKEPYSLSFYQKIFPKFFRTFFARTANLIPFHFKGKSFLTRGYKSLEERFIGNAFIFSLEEKKKILKNSTIASNPSLTCKKFYQESKNYDDITKMQYLDMNMWLVGDILLKADRMSMANSLELRVPFLDKEVFGVASTLPTNLKVTKETTKFAFRKAAEKRLPKDTAQKRKLGFPVPVRIWLQNKKYYEIVKKEFSSEIAEKFFNKEYLISVLDQHLKGKVDNSRKIWTIYTFLVWYNLYFCD